MIKIKLIFLLFITVVVISSFFMTSSKRDVMDLAMDNIEALADNEFGNEACVGSGSVDCRGYKVYCIIGYNSLEHNY